MPSPSALVSGPCLGQPARRMLIGLVLCAIVGVGGMGCRTDAPEASADADRVAQGRASHKETAADETARAASGTDTPSRTDALGRTVDVQPPVGRVVSLAPNLTELVFAAGGADALVAVTTAANHPPAVDSLRKVSALPVDFEAVAAADPDVVLATTQVNAARDADTFEALDIPVYFFSFASVGDVFGALRTLGDLLGTEATATRRAARLEARLDRLRRQTAALDPPRVLVLIGDDTLYAFGKGSYVHTLVEAAGGTSITASLAAAAPTLSDEYVLEQQPDVIVGAWGEDYPPDRLLQLHPTWDVVPALQNDRVYSLNPDLLLRPGPRIVDGAWAMARFLHPTAVPDSSAQTHATP